MTNRKRKPSSHPTTMNGTLRCHFCDRKLIDHSLFDRCFEDSRFLTIRNPEVVSGKGGYDPSGSR